jgi:hypothetical protein
MAAYPTGTVTFLFTDIEGSTKLLQQLDGDYAAVVGDRTTAADDLGVRISRQVESLVEAQLESVFAGGKPPTTKLAGLTPLGLFTTFVVIAGLVGIGFLIKVAFF